VGNGSNTRPWKFYHAQVEKIISLLERHFTQGSIDLDKYLKICEQLGEEPNPDKMPVTVDQYPLEVQQAFLIHDLLPDRWDGMSGSYFGKDMSALGSLLDIWEIEDKRTIVYFIKHIEARKVDKINKELEQKRKARERSSKGGVGNIPKIKK